MKAVVVVEPLFLRSVEGDDKVELVIPNGTVEDVVAIKKSLVALLEDEREDMVMTIPGAPRVQVTRAEKVKDVVSA